MMLRSVAMFYNMFRFVWALEDWTLQELSSQYVGGLDCQDSCIGTTLDKGLQSSTVSLM